MCLLKGNIMDFSNFDSLLNPEKVDELNSISIARLVLQLFVSVKNHESNMCGCLLCEILKFLIETIIIKTMKNC